MDSRAPLSGMPRGCMSSLSFHRLGASCLAPDVSVTTLVDDLFGDKPQIVVFPDCS